MKRFLFAAMLGCATLSGCASSTPAIVTAKAAGTAESAYQVFLVEQEGEVSAGKLDALTFHAREQKAHSALLMARAGQITVGAFTAQLATLGAAQ